MTTTRIKLTGPADNTPAAAQIDMTPTWAGIMPALVAALQNGTGDGQRIARAELARLAQEVDSANEAARLERAKAPAVPAGQASHLKTATAALAGVLADMSRQNVGTAAHAAHTGRRAAFTARAHAFAHAATTAAERGGNDSAELKAKAAELADRMAEELAELDSERRQELKARDTLREEAATAREGEEVARVALSAIVAELDSGAFNTGGRTPEGMAEHGRRALNIARNAITGHAPAAMLASLGTAPVAGPGDHAFTVRFTVPAEELETFAHVTGRPAYPVAAMAGILQRDLYDESGMAGQFEIVAHVAPGEEAGEEVARVAAELARVQELAARAFVRLSAVVADAGSEGQPPRLERHADREELARAIVAAGDALQLALDAAPAEGAAIREHARDAAAMLESYANGRHNAESRGQALATVRAIRAALS